MKCHNIMMIYPQPVCRHYHPKYTLITLAPVSYLRSFVVRAVHQHRTGVGSIPTTGPYSWWIFFNSSLYEFRLVYNIHSYQDILTLYKNSQPRVKCHNIMMIYPQPVCRHYHPKYTLITLAPVSYLRSLVVRAVHWHRTGVWSIATRAPYSWWIFLNSSL